MKSISSTILAITAAVLATSPLVARAHGVSPTGGVPGKAELLSLLRVQRGMFPALQASYRTVSLGASVESVPERTDECISFTVGGSCQSELRIFQSAADATANPSGCRSTRFAEDGVAALFLRLDEDSAVLGPKADVRGGVPIAWSSELLWTMRWIPAGGSAGTAHPGDLESLLLSEFTSVLPSRMMVDGVECVVLERRVGDALIERFWLDEGAGFLPRLQQAYQADGEVSLERRVCSFVDAGSGAWLPNECQLWVKGDGMLVPADSTRRTSLVVDESWSWPLVVGAAPMSNFSSVQDVLPEGFLLD